MLDQSPKGWQTFVLRATFLGSRERLCTFLVLDNGKEKEDCRPKLEWEIKGIDQHYRPSIASAGGSSSSVQFTHSSSSVSRCASSPLVHSHIIALRRSFTEISGASRLTLHVLLAPSGFCGAPQSHSIFGEVPAYSPSWFPASHFNTGLLLSWCALFA